ncbi:MAG TPA: hypothetical protein VJZ78_00940 [Anaerolineales bacterium]|nr:hypothetical protein [Anaerolineales bacterium]
MERITLDQIKELAQQKADPCISIFLPTHRAGLETQQDAIRFRNLLRNAEKQLLNSGMKPREASALVQPAQKLSADSFFWNHQQDGLAVFIAADDFHYYLLPLPVDELLIISHTYYVKPILPLFTKNGHYFILAISQNEVRLFEGTRYGVGQIALPDGITENMKETLRLDESQENLQMHSDGGGGTFHGQGAGDEEQKIWIEQYLNLVDTSLKEILREQNAPLVLAGVDYLLPIFRKVSDYKNIMEEGITGNPDRLRPEELQEKAWQIVETYFQKETKEILEEFQKLADTNIATDDIERIVTAAFNGRVEKLILSIENQIWGSFDPIDGKVILSINGQSKTNNLALLDFTALNTLKNGGVVCALSQDEMPTESPVAAVFRY